VFEIMLKSRIFEPHKMLPYELFFRGVDLTNHIMSLCEF